MTSQLPSQGPRAPQYHLVLVGRTGDIGSWPLRNRVLHTHTHKHMRTQKHTHAPSQSREPQGGIASSMGCVQACIGWHHPRRSTVTPFTWNCVSRVISGDIGQHDLGSELHRCFSTGPSLVQSKVALSVDSKWVSRFFIQHRLKPRKDELQPYFQVRPMPQA